MPGPYPPGYWAAFNAKRRQDPTYREKQAAWNKLWYETAGATPERLARRADRMRAYTADPEKRIRHEARWQVRRAVKAGRLTRLPCQICGEPKAEAHHDDYSKPLDVRWLCRKHHREHHAKAVVPPATPEMVAERNREPAP